MMRAPVLPLRAKDLNSLTSVGIIAAWMLFPDNEVRRNGIIARYATQEFLGRVNQMPLERDLRFTPPQVTEMLATALDAANKDDIERWHLEREPIGTDIGGVAWLAIQEVRVGNPHAVADAIKKIEMIKRGGKTTDSSDLKNKRTLFKPVTALWIAYIETYDPNDPGIFPCYPDAVVPFLSIADGFRRLGENTRARRQSESIIPADSSVLFPDDVLAILPPLDATVQANSGHV